MERLSYFPSDIFSHVTPPFVFVEFRVKMDGFSADNLFFGNAGEACPPSPSPFKEGVNGEGLYLCDGSASCDFQVAFPSDSAFLADSAVIPPLPLTSGLPSYTDLPPSHTDTWPWAASGPAGSSPQGSSVQFKDDFDLDALLRECTVPSQPHAADPAAAAVTAPIAAPITAAPTAAAAAPTGSCSPSALPLDSCTGPSPVSSHYGFPAIPQGESSGEATSREPSPSSAPAKSPQGSKELSAPKATDSASKKRKSSCSPTAAISTGQGKRKRNCTGKVEIACHNCRRAKVGCRVEPGQTHCSRCISKGKDDCCFDAQARKRGLGKNNPERQRREKEEEQQQQQEQHRQTQEQAQQICPVAPSVAAHDPSSANDEAWKAFLSTLEPAILHGVPMGLPTSSTPAPQSL